MTRLFALSLCIAFLSACGKGEQVAPTQTLRVAVAANFAPTLKLLAGAFRQEQPVRVQTMIGSTGMLYAQLAADAPFDLFFAADMESPQKLVDAGKALGPLHVYALGRLVLWVPKPNFKSPLKRLMEGEYRHLSLANPELAPYGRAAREVLIKQGLWQSVQPQLVRGQNVGQAYQYLYSGRAEMGFVALAQITQQEGVMQAESLWQIPPSLYSPIKQAAVLIPGKRQALAQSFLDFCMSKQGQMIIQAAGYGLPEPD